MAPRRKQSFNSQCRNLFSLLLSHWLRDVCVSQFREREREMCHLCCACCSIMVEWSNIWEKNKFNEPGRAPEYAWSIVHTQLTFTGPPWPTEGNQKSPFYWVLMRYPLAVKTLSVEETEIILQLSEASALWNVTAFQYVNINNHNGCADNVHILSCSMRMHC